MKPHIVPTPPPTRGLRTSPAPTRPTTTIRMPMTLIPEVRRGTWDRLLKTVGRSAGMKAMFPTVMMASHICGRGFLSAATAIIRRQPLRGQRLRWTPLWGMCAALRLPRNEDQFARVLRPVWAPVEVRVHILDLEPGSRQQVLRLEAEQVPERKGVHQPLLAAVRMGDVVDQLHVLHLVVEIERCDTIAPDHSSTIGHRERLFVLLFRPVLLVHQAIGVRVEQGQHQPPAVDEMAANTREAGEVVLNAYEVQEGTERRRHQAEPPAQVEVPHVRLHELRPSLHARRLARELLMAEGEHPRGEGQAG